jgi:cystathionine beta-lyase/cystathionine gamma-synthase
MKAIEVFKLVKLTPSFGGTSTTVSHSATSSHKCLGQELRKKLGINDGILRVSVGLEDVDVIWKDLYNGLLAAAQVAHACGDEIKINHTNSTCDS